MLGGVDHAAALIEGQTSFAPARLVVAAGPLFFQDPVVEDQGRQQQIWKAEAIAASLRRLGLIAWAPGANDWAAGAGELERLAQASGAVPVGANLKGQGWKGSSVRRVDVSGVPVGIAGISVPEHGNNLPPGIEVQPAAPALEQARAELTRQGARLLVAVLAMPRGAALRLVEQVGGWHLVVVGKPSDQGETNDEPTPPVRINRTLVVQSPNHLQSLAIVDFIQRGDSFEFQDGSGLERVAHRESLERRIHELKSRIETWESKPGVSPADLGARKRDLERLQRELKRHEPPKPPAAGSFFRYELSDVRERLGSDDKVAELMAAYYRRVNEHNREAYADRKPPPVPSGVSGYVGIEKCTSCHIEERAFWNKTGHANAYVTLERQHKQFNLDCVGCHVTGYEQPGGSTVTHVSELKDVQCETCHGPGSRHVAEPKNPDYVVAKPPRTLCAPACHHPPHVNKDWRVDEAWPHIIGPGHGG
jgi:hypothetical protein